MRIQLYGVQGSGSVFPRLREREAEREVADYQLLKRVFERLEEFTDESGHLNCRIEEILGGEPDRATLLAYRQKVLPANAISYGGWTTCIHVETDDGHDLVFDCGSGFRHCARDLERKWSDRSHRLLHIFGSHSHRDHTEGFDQAPVCFDSRNHIAVYGNHQFLHALDSYLGVFSRKTEEGAGHVHTPISYEMMPAQFSCHVIGKQNGGSIASSAKSTTPIEDPIEIGETRITPFALYHPAPCLGYCVESRGRKFVFATDHETRIPADGAQGDNSPEQEESLAAEARLSHFSQEADVLYRDGQFLRSEYLGEKGVGESSAILRRDWGHSCIEDVQEMAFRCRVKHTLIGHHDPNREWAERRWIDQSLNRHGAQEGRIIELAKAETAITL